MVSAIIKGLGTVLKGLGKLIGKAAKKYAVSKALNTKPVKKVKKFLFTVIGILLLVLVCGFLSMFGAVSSWADFLKDFFSTSASAGEEVSYDEWVNSTKNVYEAVLNNEELEFTDGNLALIDRDTLTQIFEAILEYDAKREDSLKIQYEYEVCELVEVTELELPVRPGEEDKKPMLTPEPFVSPAPTVWELQEHYEYAYTTVQRSDIEKTLDESGHDFLELRWQPIVALAAYVIQENYADWGSYDDNYVPTADLSKVDLTHYFLSDELIKDIINIFYYRATYRYDAIQREDDYYAFGDFCNGINEVAYYYYYTENAEGEYTKKYIPASAPMTVKNSFVNYTYNYVETTQENVYTCDSRTCTFVPAAFLRSCERIIPDFDGERYVAILKMLPGCEDLVTYYEDKVVPMGKANMIDTYTETDSDVCPVIGVLFYSPHGIEDGALGGIVWDGGDFAVPIYEEKTASYHVIPLAELEDTDDGGKVYYLSSGAVRRCDVSDNLSVDDIYRLLTTSNYLKSARLSCPLFADDDAIWDTARCLYDYQESSGDSVLAILGLITQEGGWTTRYATGAWNFGHFVTYSDLKSYTYVNSSGEVVTSRFADFKSVYENTTEPYSTPCVNALNRQITYISNNYWQHPDRLQNNFYLMIWKGYWDGVNTGTASLSNIYHSYCPPWDDPAMPYSSDSYVLGSDGKPRYYWKNSSLSHLGWPNKCAYYRSVFERQLGIVYDKESYEAGG